MFCYNARAYTVNFWYKWLSIDHSRTLLDQTVAELKHQVALLKQRESKVTTENKELQHTILDLESRLNELKDATSKVNFDTVCNVRFTSRIKFFLIMNVNHIAKLKI